MSIPQTLSVPWTKKHDKPGTPLIPQAPLVVFPQSLEDLITICSTRLPDQRLHAAGSHWALSPAAVSDHTFIETHDYNNIQPAMGRTLFDVVPGCLSDEFLSNLDAKSRAANSATEYYVHFESGKRIYQLYSELDMGDSQQAKSLCQLMVTRFNNNKLFQGSWGFHTLGGAGGQTVVGAVSTGTHGGDFDRPPLADDVVALHLVTDGGKHYWIERGRSATSIPFTDEAKLRAHYGQFGGFDVIYDDDIWSAAIIEVGRFGVVYSAVLRVVPQYGLRQKTMQTDWETVRGEISKPLSDLFIEPFKSPSQEQPIPQRFLQIVINPIPSTNGTTHICFVTKRWAVPLKEKEVDESPLAAVSWIKLVPSIAGLPDPGKVAGRPERVGNLPEQGGNIVLDPDPLLNASRFANAGASVPYSPDESGVTSFSFLDSACQDANFMDGVVSGIYTGIENFLSNNTVAIGGGLAGALAEGAGPGIIALVPELAPILALLAIFLHSLRNVGSTIGQALNDLRHALLSLGEPNSPAHAAGLLVWRAIVAGAFTSQKPKDCSAISYAVMDTHDYTDVSCAVNVRSVEVFFDAVEPNGSWANLIAFVDRLLQFESDQEFEAGKSVAGYISLRFSGPSAALIAPGPFPLTVAVECSGLADEAGSTDFVNYAVGLALDPNIKGNLHWGQQNDSTQQEIEFRFGDAPNSPTGPLHTWRSILSRLTDNGRNDGFSSDFTRRTGLEIVQPQIGSFVVTTAPSSANPSCMVTWDCISNPPQTTIALDIAPPSAGVTSIAGLPLNGNHTFDASGIDSFVVTLHASLERNGVTRTASQNLSVQVGPVVG